MLQAKEVVKLTKNINILYAEDNKDISDQMVEIFELFFESVKVAKDGQEALELFEKGNFDIIITDIQMPKLNGLELIEHVRKKDLLIPIIITTAFNEQDYLLKSIELKVDRYLLKPIKSDQAISVFYDIAQLIDNRKKAAELEKIRLRETLEQSTKETLTKLSDAYTCPAIIFKDDKLYYFSEPFAELAASNGVIVLEDGIGIEKMVFEQKDGFLPSLLEYSEENPLKNKIYLSQKVGKKIFKVKKKNIEIQNSKMVIFILQDITLEEYQKAKIESYVGVLENWIFKGKKSKIFNKEIASKAIEEEVSKKEVLKQIDSTQKEVLKRSHSEKTSAKDYVLELDRDTLLELQELDELDAELEQHINMFNENDTSALGSISKGLAKYAHEINLLFEFKDLSFAINSLSDLIGSIDLGNLDDKKLKNLGIYFDGIKDDLASWRKNIFVNQDAIDIHYLDSSLFSSCLQIELSLSSEADNIDHEDDDLTFF